MFLQSGAGLPPGIAPPKNFDKALVDKPAQVSDAAAFTTCNFLAKKLGLLVGGSAGGVVFAALKFLTENRVRTAVVLFADAGEKYLTIFNESWMTTHNLYDENILSYLSHETETRDI